MGELVNDARSRPIARASNPDSQSQINSSFLTLTFRIAEDVVNEEETLKGYRPYSQHKSKSYYLKRTLFYNYNE